LADFFCAVHLFFCAALIRARASALTVRLPPRRLWRAAPLSKLRASISGEQATGLFQPVYLTVDCGD
jgi:hypothetical protein